MRVPAKLCLVLGIVVLLFGCGSSDVDVQRAKKDVADMNRQVVELQKKVGALEGSITKLDEQTDRNAKDFAELQGALGKLNEQGKEAERRSDALAEAVGKLESGHNSLNRTVTEAVSTLSKPKHGSEHSATLESRASSGTIQLRKTNDKMQAPSTLARPSGEVCDAIEKYTQDIDKIMRRGASPATESQMAKAVEAFKDVARKHQQDKNASHIWLLAQELKWAAYNASKSGTYVAQGGGWKKQAEEYRRQLKQFCGSAE